MSMKSLSKRLNLRIAVGSLEGPRSGTWRIVSHNDEIYVSEGDRQNSKLSFHQSGVCRDAFNQEYGVPITMANRVKHRWLRAAVPDAESGRACLLLRIWIATDFLSAATAVPTKRVFWLPPALPGCSRVIELLISRDNEQRLVAEMKDARTLLAYKRLPNGVAAVVSSRIVEDSNEDFGFPASHHQNRSLLISARDPNSTGRPVRVFVGNLPKDGDCKEIWEFGGYYLDGPLPKGIGLFNRQTVFATQDTPTVKLGAIERDVK